MNTKQGTIVGREGRSISVRYGDGVTDILLIRPCDFHDGAPTGDGERVELRYVQGAGGCWWHAFPATIEL